MNDKLLYFPYINIPQNNWTIKSLLYWDEIGVIVPPTYIRRTHLYEDFTKDLLKTNLITQVFPYEHTWKVPNFETGFMQLINHPSFDLNRKQQRFNNGYRARIHLQKFGEQNLNFLVDSGIALRIDWEWFVVERETANIIMLYLATIIGKVGEFTPSTDRFSFSNYYDNPTSIIRTNFSHIRQKLLEEVMPFPSNPNLSKLRDFKEKYKDELKGFRMLLEQSVIDIGNIQDREIQLDRFKLTVEEINYKKEIISSNLNSSKFGQISLGSICGLTGAAYGFSQDNTALGIFSLANALYSAFQGYDNAPILENDYSYLALIDKKLM
jgi:hypothetical protein